MSARILALLTVIMALTAAPPIAAQTLLTEDLAKAVPVREGRAATPDGVELYYRVAGSGDEVVIAPFALYHGSAFDRLAKGRRIVTYDPRGRGRSQAVSPDRVSLDLLLTDLDTIRRALGEEQVAVIGWSGGGMESFVYALRNPGRVSRLIQLASVGPRFSPYSEQMMADRKKRTDTAAQAAYNAKVSARAFAGRQDERCRVSAAISLPALFHDRSEWTIVPDVCDFANEHPEALAAYFGGLFESIEGFDWRTDLPKVAIPRLVVHPLQDNIPPAASEEWVRGQPNARLVTIEGAGHFPHYEQPAATLQAIGEFLDGRWPATAQSLPAN
jgi:pimeloyl-ACP methyl ester carboxylesterase